MHRYRIALSTPVIALLTALSGTGRLPTALNANSVTAIDVLLDPDATMIERATTANARLRTAYPKGFALDETHQPHISCLQRYVATADLDKVYAAVGKVLAEEKPGAWTLEAVKYDFAVWDKLDITAIVVEPTDKLLRFQKKLIDAVAPYTVKTGTATAFATTTADPEINKPTIDYVATYVPDASGKKFIPHVTVGVAPPDDAKKMRDEKFDAFTFSPVSVSVFQLGNFGTAAKRLKSWRVTP